MNNIYSDALDRITEQEAAREDAMRKTIVHMQNALKQLELLTDTYHTGSDDEIECWNMTQKTSSLIKEIHVLKDTLEESTQ